MYLVICKFQTIGNFLLVQFCKFKIKISILNTQRLNNTNNNENSNVDSIVNNEKTMIIMIIRRIIKIYEGIVIQVPVDEIGRRGIAHLQPRSDHLLLNGDNPGTLRALVHLGGSDYLVTVMFRCLGVDHPLASWLDHHEHDYFH